MPRKREKKEVLYMYSVHCTALLTLKCAVNSGAPNVCVCLDVLVGLCCILGPRALVNNVEICAAIAAWTATVRLATHSSRCWLFATGWRGALLQGRQCMGT